jgi:hypothetical protein
MPPAAPRHLPLLTALSWFDADPHALTPFEMLCRYERGARHIGVLAAPTDEERAFMRALAAHFGSVLDVPA